MTKHTQVQPTAGPWHLGVLMGKRGRHIEAVCRLPATAFGDTPEERDANASLIAAAPELLAACQLTFAELDDRYDVDQPAGESAKEYPFSGAGELMRKLRAVITKAGGTL